MNSQVDLFKSGVVKGESSRISGALETRSFKLIADLDELDKKLIYYNAQALHDYKTHLKELVAQGRHYEHVNGYGRDNLFELEALGVGEYCKQYTCILDISDCLDLVLHYLTGCKIESVRNMQDYSKISKAFLNYDFSEIGDIPFDRLFHLDDKMDQYLTKLYNNITATRTGTTDEMADVVNALYAGILSKAMDIKDYLIVHKQIHSKKGSFVYRSKSFSASIATSEVPVNDDIEILENGQVIYSLKMTSYGRFEYVRERVLL